MSMTLGDPTCQSYILKGLQIQTQIMETLFKIICLCLSNDFKIDKSIQILWVINMWVLYSWLDHVDRYKLMNGLLYVPTLARTYWCAVDMRVAPIGAEGRSVIHDFLNYLLNLYFRSILKSWNMCRFLICWPNLMVFSECSKKVNLFRGIHCVVFLEFYILP